MTRPHAAPRCFPEILTALMQEKGFSVRGLARAANVPPASISDWKSARHSPTDYDALGRVADALGVSLSYLLRGRDDVAARTSPVTISDMFVDGNVIFDGVTRIEGLDGYARIRIQALIPRQG